MSSHITIEDLLGKISLRDDGTVHFQSQPFSEAWEKGWWILFDECNLASSSILQCIELALDTNKLMVTDQSSSENGSRQVLTRHPDFRLFATQNPNTGMFRGCRQKLSNSFLSRFAVTIFEDIPPKELREIVSQNLIGLLPPKEVDETADKMVTVHEAVETMFDNAAYTTDRESGPHSVVSVRDLLKWVSLFKCMHSQQQQDRSVALGMTGWCTYGSRFRGIGRRKVESILDDHDIACSPREQNMLQLGTDSMVCIPLLILDHWCDNQLVDRVCECHAKFNDMPIRVTERNILDKAITKLCDCHAKILNLVLTPESFRSAGLYVIADTWALDVIDEGLKRYADNLKGCVDAIPYLAKEMYSGRFRNMELKSQVVDIIIAEFSIGAQKSILSEPVEVASCKPFVVTPRIITLFWELSCVVHSPSPILLCGANGVGKSECLRVFSWLMGRDSIEYCCLTPEVEPTALVGQIIPDTDHGGTQQAAVRWMDGTVTCAIRRDTWVLLDNLDQAESSCLERLNPVLESPPQWSLTERGECDCMNIRSGFRVCGTMTISSTSNFSPAFYNRFSVLYLGPFDEMELPALIAAYCGTTDTLGAKIHTICIGIANIFKNHRQPLSMVGMRAFSRMLDSIYQLARRSDGAKCDTLSALAMSAHSCFVSQSKDLCLREDLRKLIASVLGAAVIDRAKMLVGLPEQSRNASTVHVLTPTRLSYRHSLLSFINCSQPVLLEVSNSTISVN